MISSRAVLFPLVSMQEHGASSISQSFRVCRDEKETVNAEEEEEEGEEE